MANLQEQIMSQIHEIFKELKQQKQVNPSILEVQDTLAQKHPRLPKAILQSKIKIYFQDNVIKEQKEVKDVVVIEDKQPQKKVKIENVNNTQNNNIAKNNSSQVLDEETLMQFPTLNDVGGIESIKSQIESMIYMPLQYAHIFTELGSNAPKGILLTGATGCGKTYLAKAICRDLYQQFKLNIFMKNGAEIVASLSGESEKNIRQLFQQAAQEAPSLVFIDDIDVIAGDRDKANKQMEKRVVTQIMGSLDQLPNNVFLIATTSHPDQLDPALRRSGRFDKEIMITVPTDEQREDILKKLIKPLKVNNIDFYSLSRRTPGYVASDLFSLSKEAAVEAVKRLISSEETIEILPIDFEMALKKVQPTAKREGFAVIPDVTWSDIGSLQELRKELDNCLVLPIQNPEVFQKFKVRPPAGVLLWGPPGCGKTLLAKAVANASRANFIAVKGPEILNKYVGESEKAIRGLFTRARASQPCIIFFDEIDAICPVRGNDGGGQVTERVVNQLLTELDGFEDRKQVFIIAASNRPDILDPAILRPGRIDKPLYVPLPDESGREDILRTLAKKSPIDDVDFKELAMHCENFTGADLSNLVTTAALDAIISQQNVITQQNFINSLKKIRPSISEADRKAYEKLRQKIQM
ncbi:unnamed protein product [Paramecium primaurelia]|uniref:AAA+ ATPase domain-containing protein n=1 Tax=Paramecium primaurelia TaxID=5886 RepID=A0A8S1JP12_PARPR|nr:unnamed protein product [Paramecium primaurelia]